MAGLHLRLGLGSSAGSGAAHVFVNPEAEAIVAAMTVTPSNSRQALIDDTVGALKAGGAWTPLDVLHVYAAHTAQASSINWKNPGTFNATVVNMPIGAFVADRGWNTNGTDSYIDTNFNPATALGNFAQDSACFGMWIGNDKGGGYDVAGGWQDATDGVRLNPRAAVNRADFRINQALVSSTTDGDTLDARGLSVVNRSGATAIQFYKNGAAKVLLSNPTPASTAMNSNNLYCGRSSATQFNDVDVRAVIIGGSMGAPAQTALYNAINGYLTPIGAGVS